MASAKLNNALIVGASLIVGALIAGAAGLVWSFHTSRVPGPRTSPMAFPVRAVDCFHAPYGVTRREYKTVLADVAKMPSSLVPPRIMAKVVQSDIQSACVAKYHETGFAAVDAHYATVGISARQIKEDSVFNLTFAVMAAENHRAKVTRRSHELHPKVAYITVSQFVADAPTLAMEHAWVSISGVFVRDGNMKYLFGTRHDVWQMAFDDAYRDGFGPSFPKIPLTTNASSTVRRMFSLCGAQLESGVGCRMRVAGTAGMCIETDSFGGFIHLPCVNVLAAAWLGKARIAALDAR